MVHLTLGFSPLGPGRSNQGGVADSIPRKIVPSQKVSSPNYMMTFKASQWSFGTGFALAANYHIAFKCKLLSLFESSSAASTFWRCDLSARRNWWPWWVTVGMLTNPRGDHIWNKHAATNVQYQPPLYLPVKLKWNGTRKNSKKQDMQQWSWETQAAVS